MMLFHSPPYNGQAFWIYGADCRYYYHNEILNSKLPHHLNSHCEGKSPPINREGILRPSVEDSGRNVKSRPTRPNQISYRPWRHDFNSCFCVSSAATSSGLARRHPCQSAQYRVFGLISLTKRSASGIERWSSAYQLCRRGAGLRNVRFSISKSP